MMNSQLQFAFFNLGPWEILLVLVVILVLFGAKRLPELARGLGLGINEFRDAVGIVQRFWGGAVGARRGKF